MTNEEIQRVMEFIIKQQESFAEGMEQMRELHAQAEGRISQLEVATVHLYNSMSELAKSQIALTEKMAVLAEAQAQLNESLAHTDQRVNALIDILDQRRNEESED
ncbi:MAG TPA: hypothetical protein VFS10_04430 [Pyrinomonadaceae bacterium]|nr:hypothetical protein [Pyrinomonadaceae bacterium]